MINKVRISKDYFTSERAGAGGTYQINSITAIDENENENEVDLTEKVDQGKHYHSDSEVLADLGLPTSIAVEEV